MADTFDAYARGLQAGQNEVAHNQALEDNKLRSMVLKHQLDAIPIENAIRARELAKSNFDLMNGQPAADLPTESVTKQQPFTPSTSSGPTGPGAMTGLPDVVSSMVRANMGMPGATPEQGASTTGTPTAQPSFIAAPTAQSTASTFPVTSQQTTAVNIPGVAGLGIPGVSVRPRSAEDLIRQQVLSKLSEPVKLGEGDVLSIPATGQVLAKGGTKPVVVGAGGTLVNPDAPPGTPPIATGGAPASEFGQFQQIYAESLGKTRFADLTPQEKAGAIPAFNQAKSTGGNVQTKSVLLDGNPTELTFNPRTQKWSDASGVEITNPAGRIRPLSAPVADVGVNADVRTTATGRSYVDLSKYKGKDYSAAQQQAHTLGVYGANASESDALQNIDTARENFSEIAKSIGKLPTSATSRLIVGPLNKAEAFTQTDPDLAAWGTYRSAAIQALRAMAGAKGLRINKAEIETSMANDIPNITDTQATAKQKLERVGKMLDNQENGVLGKAGAATPKLPTAAGGMIQAKDPQGNIHHAPAGTPLPTGWTLVQ